MEYFGTCHEEQKNILSLLLNVALDELDDSIKQERNKR